MKSITFVISTIRTFEARVEPVTSTSFTCVIEVTFTPGEPMTVETQDYDSLVVANTMQKGFVSALTAAIETKDKTFTLTY